MAAYFASVPATAILPGLDAVRANVSVNFLVELSYASPAILVSVKK